MARYEGMEELLQRVRTQLEMPGIGDGTDSITAMEKIDQSNFYARSLEALLAVVRDIEHLHRVLTQAWDASITSEQQSDLEMLLSKAHHELRLCEWKVRQ